MTTSTFRNTKYEDLGETWRCHQTARILSRHLQFGKHCRLDLDALLVGMARTIRRESPDSVPGENLLQPTIGDAADDYSPAPNDQLTRNPHECPLLAKADIRQ